MNQYYIKKLGRQEMGSPNKIGKAQRGRYILFSINSDDFFPHLSKTILNDTLVLPIVTPYSDGKVYAKLVYHNAKYAGCDYHKRKHNEYRLYLNNELDCNKRFFNVGEIIVVEKISSPESDMGFVYSITLYNKSSPHYHVLNNMILKSPMQGEHAMYEGNLSFVPQITIRDDMKTIISDAIIKLVGEEQKKLKDKIDKAEVDVKTDVIEEIRGANLFTSVSFRDFVLHAYNYKCAITGKVICYDALNNLEAAHIKPKAQAGTFLPCNGIALCRDMHWAFDKGFITLSDDYEVIVHEKIKNTLLDEFAGKKIFIPATDYFKPEVKFIQYHRENIFGLFQHSGGIRSN